jgi:hypothetical protein
MLLEIVVENGTQAHGEEEVENDGGEDGEDADDEDGDDDDDDDDENSESESDDDEMEIGGERAPTLADSGDDEFHSEVPVRPWIEEDEDVSDWPAFAVKHATIATAAHTAAVPPQSSII